MRYKIGMDFGTTNSTVSFFNESGDLSAFRYPAAEGYEYIPSCVAYENGGGVHIGRAALDYAGDSETIFCSNLKMILPLSAEKREAFVWPKIHRPEQVITDYFQRILCQDKKESSSFLKQKGKIEELVLSVPHVWSKSMDHAGRSRLQEIVENGLQLRLKQLISEPVAAATYYAYLRQQESSQAFSGNLLICDMGGGTFDVTLCRVEPGRVEELHNDGNGRLNLGRAGVAFDRRLIMAKIQEKGETITENSPEFYEFYDKLQNYKAHHHETITQSLQNALDDPDLAARPILRAGKFGFNLTDIQQAFGEIETGVSQVLTRFKTAVDQKGYRIDQVFFVGGFSQFLLVRECIKKYLGLTSSAARVVEESRKEISRFAISYGAALIANDLMAVEERYEHSIGVIGHILKDTGRGDGSLESITTKFPIIIGGQILSKYSDIHYARQPVRVHDGKPEITIYLDRETNNKIVEKKLPDNLGICLPNYGVPGNRWKVGMYINRSKIVYLVFEDAQQARTEYELGDIIRQVFPGLEFLMEEGQE